MAKNVIRWIACVYDVKYVHEKIEAFQADILSPSLRPEVKYERQK